MYASPQAVIDEVEAQVCRDFVQRGNRLMPLKQADVDSAVTKAVAMSDAILRGSIEAYMKMVARTKRGSDAAP